MAGRKIRGADEARSCLAAAEASGRPRAEWARAHGIDARSLNAWRLNLGRQAQQVGELRLVELVPRATSTPTARPVRYRIRSRGFIVEVDERFDSDTLARLLTVVAGC